jgi:hypothetical protein
VSSKPFNPSAPVSARRYAPATLRNREPILDVLARDFTSRGLVLEIASGSGEHAAFFGARLPHLTWQPSDVAPEHCASVDAWTSGGGLSNVKKAVHLDATSDEWPIVRVDGIVCINMLHVTPPEAREGLLRGASRGLNVGGALVIYGPFREGGRHTALSNERFDADLRFRNESWGVPDLDEVVARAAELGLAHTETVRMPANNLTVVFRKQ